jgi:hypothetical protein
VIEQYYSLAYGILAKLMVDKINGKLIYKWYCEVKQCKIY